MARWLIVPLGLALPASLALAGCPDDTRTGYEADAGDAAPGDAGAASDGAADAEAGLALAYVFLGDWNGDAIWTPATYDTAAFRWTMIDVNAGAPPASPRQFVRGETGTIPVVGDFDGDGYASTGTYDPATGEWRISNENDDGYGVDDTFVWRQPGVPVVGDWDGNRTATPGFYDPASHLWRLSNKAHPDGVDLEFELGTDGGIPVVGDWNFDRLDNAGIYDPATHRWTLKLQNFAGGDTVTTVWGADGSLPLAARIAYGAAGIARFDPRTATFTYAKGLADGGDLTLTWGTPGRYTVSGGPILGSP